MTKKTIAILIVSLNFAHGAVLAQGNAGPCYQQDEQLLNSSGVIQNPLTGQGVTAEELIFGEAYVRSERLSRSGVEYIESKKSFGSGPAGQLSITEVGRAVEVPGDGNCDGITFIKNLEQEEIQELPEEQGMTREQTAEFLALYSEGLLGLGAALEQKMPGGMGDDQIENSITGMGPGGGGCAIVAHATKYGTESYSDTVAVGKPIGADDDISGASPGGLFSPLVFLGGPACMTAAMSAHLMNYTAEDDTAVAQRGRDDLTAAAVVIEYVGTEDIDGSAAGHISALGINSTHTSDDGTTMTIDDLHAWIDLGSMARKKMRFEGTMESQGEEREFFMETEFYDFRRVADSLLYEPYRQVMRAGGVLGPKELKQMEEAQEKMADFEKQMATMPASQRQMMEDMMGPQLEQMRSLMNNGTVEFEFITTEIRINPDFNAAVSPLESTSEPINLVQIIQGHLTSLGYTPGNTNGELDKMTVVAITQFEASKGMPITGQATPQLAGILAAAVDAQN
jgi:hypothetical protein